MHEYSLVQAMLDQIEEMARAHEARRVRRVSVRVGRGAGVEIALFRTAYDLCREGTLCAEAAIEIEEVPVRWGCPKGHGTLSAGSALRCPDCGSPACLTSGDEIILERVELEVA